MGYKDELKNICELVNEDEESFVRRAVLNEIKKANIALFDYVEVADEENEFTLKRSEGKRILKILAFHEIPFEILEGDYMKIKAKITKEDFDFLYERMDWFEEDVRIPSYDDIQDRMPDENLVKMFNKMYNNNGYSY
jgi:hypothetical protein